MRSWPPAPLSIAPRLQFVGHADPVKPLLSVAENVRFASVLTGGAGAVGDRLDGFDLQRLADTPGRFLSWARSGAHDLARLLASPRPLWLLDEPGVGLDRANRVRLEAAIAAHRRSGGICILASHGDVAVADPYVLDFTA